MTKDEKKHITDRVEHWAREFFLAGYGLDIVFEKENERKPDDVDSDWAPAALALEGYGRHKRGFIFHVYPRFTDFSEREQQQLIVHEFGHAISDPLSRLLNHLLNDRVVTRREAVEAEEEVADWIAAVVLRGR